MRVDRTPVLFQKRDWTNVERQVVMGVDPGFAAVGLGAVERAAPGAPIKCIGVRVVATKKVGKKNMRITNEDFQRYQEIVKGMDEFRAEHNPYAVGIEAYRMAPAGAWKKDGKNLGGGSAKTMAVYGGIVMWATARDMFAAPFLPNDIKKRFCGKVGASKYALELQMRDTIEGFDELVDALPKTKREHVADAVGHAVLVLDEVDRVRKMLGLSY